MGRNQGTGYPLGGRLFASGFVSLIVSGALSSQVEAIGASTSSLSFPALNTAGVALASSVRGSLPPSPLLRFRKREIRSTAVLE